MATKSEKWGRVVWVACLSTPALASALAILIMMYVRPPSVVWQNASSVRWAGLATPLCLVFILLQWLVAPPVTWHGRLVALAFTAVTVVMVAEWGGVFVNFFGPR